MDDAEAQMRRALGLFGDAPRGRPEMERSEPGQRTGGGFMQGGAHRRRFVQDGEVPVTVVRRDASDPAPSGAAPSGPSHSRLHRVETALQTESAARDRAERALQEAQAAVQALQTKIGHNELTKNEAVAAAKRDRDAVAVLREEIATAAERLRDLEERAGAAEEESRQTRAELSEERRARKLAERLLREASEEPMLALEQTGREEAEPVRVAPRRGRPPIVHAAPEIEQEQVKWWLMEEKSTARRR